MSGTVLRALGGGENVAQEILWEGAHHGPLSTPMGTHHPTGSEIHHHLDVFALLQQIGVPG